MKWMWISSGILLLALFSGGIALVMELRTVHGQLDQLKKKVASEQQDLEHTLSMRRESVDAQLEQLKTVFTQQQHDVGIRLEQLESMLGKRYQGANARLGSVERSIAEQLQAVNTRQDELEHAQQKSPVLDKLQQELDEIRAMLEESQQHYQVTDVTLGTLPAGHGDPTMYKIPSAIPSTAREILVYARVATGYVDGGSHHFRVSVRLDEAREAAFYLYAVGQPQAGWAYNSDNFWLPMPKNRELHLQAEGKPFFGEWNSEVRIIGYR